MVEGGPRIIRSAESVPDGPDSRAVEIAGEGKYVDILETVRKEGFLEKEMNRVREEYGLDELSFLNDADREMFTVLDLYDPVTAKHCLRTYEIAREKMEKEVIPGESLAQLLEKNESITPEQFYRACLFHDIGKVEVPRVVIQHRMSEGHMLECMHHLYHEGKILDTLGLAPSASDTEIDDALKEHSLRSIDIVPAREVLSPEELAEVQHFGYSGDETLMDIIKTHEVFSGEILKNAGYTLESKIAALHHNYNNKKPEHPFAVSVLHMSVDLSEMLHIADLIEALSSSSRPYKKIPFSMPRVLHVIVEHVQTGKITPAAARFWLEDALHEYEASCGTQTEEDTAHLAVVRQFLTEIDGV